MNAKTGFYIDLDSDVYHLSTFGICKKLPNGVFRWFFPLEFINDVEAVLGIPIEFENRHVLDSTERLNSRSPLEEARVHLEKTQGKGMFKVVDDVVSKEYVVTIVKDKKEQVIKIPMNTVRQMWKTLETFPVGQDVKCHKVAESMLGRVDKLKEFKDGDKFSWPKFFGSRSDYFRYYYYPVKILQYFGVVLYSTSGVVTRTSDDWSGWW